LTGSYARNQRHASDHDEQCDSDSVQVFHFFSFGLWNILETQTPSGTLRNLKAFITIAD
jgi:hypothetical protein